MEIAETGFPVSVKRIKNKTNFLESGKVGGADGRSKLQVIGSVWYYSQRLKPYDQNR